MILATILADVRLDWLHAALPLLVIVLTVAFRSVASRLDTSGHAVAAERAKLLLPVALDALHSLDTLLGGSDGLSVRAWLADLSHGQGVHGLMDAELARVTGKGLPAPVVGGQPVQVGAAVAKAVGANRDATTTNAPGA